MKYGIKSAKVKENACVVNTFDKEDLCQPDMALTPYEILRNFTKGIPSPNLERKGYYDGDKYDYDDVLPEDYNDISDVHNELTNFQNRIAELEQKRDDLNDANKAKNSQSSENQSVSSNE